MNRKELIKIISSSTGFSTKKSADILKTMLKVISHSLKGGEDITMYPYKYNLYYFKRVEYLLDIMPENEKKAHSQKATSLITKL